MIITVKVFPNAKRSQIDSYIYVREEKVLKIFVKSPPIDGKANQEVVEVLHSTLALKKSNVSIIKGLHSSIKKIQIKTNTTFEENIVLEKLSQYDNCLI